MNSIVHFLKFYLKVVSFTVAIIFGGLIYNGNVYAAQFNGMYHTYNTSNLTTIYSDIYTTAYPVVYSPSGSNAYVMISAQPTSAGYAQVGWAKENGINGFSGQARYFYEKQQGTQKPSTVWSAVGPAEYSTHGYRVVLTSNGYWQGEVDGVAIAAYYADFSGQTAEYVEEVIGADPYKAAFSGYSSDHSIFSSLRTFYSNTTYYSPSVTAWMNDTNGNGKKDSSYYTTGSQSSTIHFWDSRY